MSSSKNGSLWGVTLGYTSHKPTCVRWAIEFLKLSLLGVSKHEFPLTISIYFPEGEVIILKFKKMKCLLEMSCRQCGGLMEGMELKKTISENELPRPSEV